MAQSAGSSGERLRWADLAKGTCIVLVVLWHVHILHYMELDWVTSVPVRRAWIELHSAMTPVRMPLFFAISGAFAATALRRPWRQVAVRRLASPYYLYVLWLCIHAAIYTGLQTDFSALRVSNVWDLPPNLVIPVNSLWYVYALALYFLVAKALSRVPPWIVLPAAALLSAAASAGWFTAAGLLGSVARNFVFFLAGAYLPHLVKHVAATARRRQLMLAGLAFAGVMVLFVVQPDVITPEVLGLVPTFGVDVVAALIAIWFGLIAAGLAARLHRISRFGSYLGRNTLPIYLMHAPLIGLVHWSAIGPGYGLWAAVLHNDVVAGSTRFSSGRW